jgi:hypothetical protein
MSSEYVYGRKAINLHGATDDYTALFVNSHSSNDGEHTPRWKLYNFSRKVDAMLYPVQCAHYCESGLTRGIKGRAITGQFDIESWRDAIREASLLTESDRFNLVDLVFVEKPTHQEQSLETLRALDSLALVNDIVLYQFEQNLNGRLVEARVALDLAKPKHVDLIWDAVNAIKVPSIYGAHIMAGLGAYAFFGSVKAALQQGYKFSKDPNPLDTQPVKVKTGLLDKYLGHSFHKFDFPVEGQPVYKDRRVVVTNWACRVLSTDPDGWFGKKLAILEQVQPGCAESAFRAYKRHMAALPVTPVKQIGTVEVLPLNGKYTAAENETRVTSQSLERWQLETVNAFFAKHGKNPQTEAVYTATAGEHLTALSMSDFAPCAMAVNAMAQA